MSKRTRVGLIMGALLLPVSLAGAVSAGAATKPADGTPQKSTTKVVSKRGVTLTSSKKEITEGDPYRLSAAIKAGRHAIKVTLQKYQPPLYVGDDADWVPVKTTNVRSRSDVRFKRVATDMNMERYRVVVTYRKAKPSISKPVNVTVWRWVPLSDYDPYYTTGGTGFGTTTINGQAYRGWGVWSFSRTGSWESRFTPGRRCNTFQGVLGVADISADGSSGTINLTADDITIYESPSLTPGMEVPVTVSLASSYRFGIQLTDTSPSGTTGRDDIESWPVIGDPAFLCTGV